MLNTSGKVVANYWLDHVFVPEAGARTVRAPSTSMTWTCSPGTARAGRCGRCWRRVRRRRRRGCPRPAEAPDLGAGADGQFLGTLQNEWAGAQSFSSFDTYLAPFVRLDGLTYDQVEQAVQEFVFNLNVPSR